MSEQTTLPPTFQAYLEQHRHSRPTSIQGQEVWHDSLYEEYWSLRKLPNVILGTPQPTTPQPPPPQPSLPIHTKQQLMAQMSSILTNVFKLNQLDPDFNVAINIIVNYILAQLHQPSSRVSRIKHCLEVTQDWRLPIGIETVED